MEHQDVELYGTRRNWAKADGPLAHKEGGAKEKRFSFESDDSKDRR